MYDYILFDLDGTLTDPGIGITNSVAYALNKYHISVEDRTQLYRFIGPPLVESFMTFYGFTHEQALAGVGYYREYYRAQGIYENRVYDGIEELLKSLKQAGKTILMATSKPEEFAVQILKHFHLDPYFDYMAGAAMDETRTSKADVIAYALNMANITDKSRCIMVGDRKHDILGAKVHGMDSMGVLFGYGDLPELTEAGADYIAKDVKDIGKILGVTG